MPQVAFFEKKFVPLSEAKVGVMTHALNYGTACFEGIRGNWNAKDGQMYLFRLKEHYERLHKSCRILKINLAFEMGNNVMLYLDDIQHTNPELFKSMAKVSILPIPYRGSAPCMAALVAGEVDMMIELGPTAIPQIKAGRIKVLGASTAERTRAMPETPTIAEAGLPGFDAYTWFAIAGPGGVPRDIVAKLHAEIVNAVAPPEVRARLEAIGAEVIANSPEEFAEFQAKEIAKWAKVIRESGIKPE